ncbi:acyl-CoA dehydrogenase family protein [Fodinicola feengrottensis]|nr:acyl-CoA dehydrogenase [Fodinicola feengrottensis]
MTYAMLHEQIGRCCSATRTILTAHDMVARTVLRCGRNDQRDQWLPMLTSGRALAGFALTEPGSGSDGRPVDTVAVRQSDGYRLSGKKTWVSGGQVADVFLVFAREDDGVTALLVTADTPGLTREPVRGLLGCRGAELAHLAFDGCPIGVDAVVGRARNAHPLVSGHALTLGRLSVAAGGVGVAQACTDASVAYATERRQGDSALIDHQLVNRMLTEMITGTEAARLLCRQAAELLDAGDPQAPMAASMAKYVAARNAVDAARDAVQIHGAYGCSADAPVERYFRDAKVLEIIEGSNEIHQQLIGRYGYTEYGLAGGRS